MPSGSGLSRSAKRAITVPSVDLPKPLKLSVATRSASSRPLIPLPFGAFEPAPEAAPPAPVTRRMESVMARGWRMEEMGVRDMGHPFHGVGAVQLMPG